MRRYLHGWLLGVALILGVPGFSGNEARATEATQRESEQRLPTDRAADSMKELAQQVIDRFGLERAYRVSPFVGPRSGGGELQALFKDAMRELGARLSDEHYEHDVQGRFAAVRSEHGITGLRVSIELFDRFGIPQDAFDASASWEDTDSIPRILSINAVMPTQVSPVVRAESLAHQWDNSPVHLVDHQVRTDSRQGYGVEILRREDGAWVRRELSAGAAGLSSLKLSERDVYAIRLYNYTSQEVAAQITIDGVNVFRFDDRVPRPKHHLVPAARRGSPGITTIEGWSFGAEEVQWFRIGTFDTSAAAITQVEDLSQVGQIVVQFSPTSLVEEALPHELAESHAGSGAMERDERRDTRPRENRRPARPRPSYQSSGPPLARAGASANASSRSVARSAGSRSSEPANPALATGFGQSQEQRTSVQYRRIEPAVATVVVQYLAE